MAAPGTGPGAADGGNQDCHDPRFTTRPRPTQTARQLSETINLPVAAFHPRPMRPSERSLVVCSWWAMRREGVILPAEKGVIVIDGGRA